MKINCPRGSASAWFSILPLGREILIKSRVRTCVCITFHLTSLLWRRTIPSLVLMFSWYPVPNDNRFDDNWNCTDQQRRVHMSLHKMSIDLKLLGRFQYFIIWSLVIYKWLWLFGWGFVSYARLHEKALVVVWSRPRQARHRPMFLFAVEARRSNWASF